MRPEKMTVDGKPLPGTTWRYVVDVSLPGGPRKQAQRRGFPTRRAAQAGLTELLEQVRQKTYVAPTTQTLKEFLEHETAIWIFLVC